MKKLLLFIITSSLLFLTGCNTIPSKPLPRPSSELPTKLPTTTIATTTQTVPAKIVPSTTSSSSTLKKIALTFDDGPYGTSTAQILDLLEKKQVPATFFVIGKNVEKFPEEAKRIVKDGFLIANHSYDHAKNLAQLPAADFKANLGKTENIIKKITGVHAVYFRPPFGYRSQTMRNVLKKKGYKIALWDVDPRDWDYENSPSTTIIKKVLNEARPNFIILMHDGRDTHVDYPRDNIVAALPVIIDALKKQGYTFVTLDKLESRDF